MYLCVYICVRISGYNCHGHSNLGNLFIAQISMGVLHTDRGDWTRPDRV